MKRCLVNLILFVCLLYPFKTAAQTYKFNNGKWFDGSQFNEDLFYVVDGFLSRDEPSEIDSVINLKGGFVIPPFAEAHNHNIEGYWDIDTVVNKYLSDGVFYVKIQNNIWDFTKEIKNKINNTNSIDVIFSNGCLTASRGHPITLYNQLYKWQYENYVPNPDWFENRAYYIIDNENDLENKWPEIISKNPDFIKIIFSYTENRKKNLLNESPYVRIGLEPKTAAKIVKKAHQSGLSVSAHIETNVDFHYAAEIGVDEISHLPGYYIHEKNKQSIAPIFEKDAETVARKGIDIITTTVLSKTVLRDSSLLPIVQHYQKQNLLLLDSKGVDIIIGSDHSETSLDELFYLKDLGIFDNLKLLKLICEKTALAIFPKRKIGFLREGYEANFLVLKSNPLSDLANIKEIFLRVKNGNIISLK